MLLSCNSLTLCPFPMYTGHETIGQQFTGHGVQSPLLPTTRTKLPFINFFLINVTLNVVRLFAPVICSLTTLKILKVSIVRLPHFFWCFHSFSLTSIQHHVFKKGFLSSLLLLSQKHLEIQTIPRILQARNNPFSEKFTV